MNAIGALIRITREFVSSLCSQPREVTAISWQFAACKRVFTRSHPSCHPDLGLPTFRAVRSKFYIPPSCDLCCSSTS